MPVLAGVEKLNAELAVVDVVPNPPNPPALARLLPKLNGVAEVVETPKFPILKFTAGLAVNPKPPKLNPLAVELAVSSPPNPDRRAGKETNNFKRGEREEKRRKRKQDKD